MKTSLSEDRLKDWNVCFMRVTGLVEDKCTWFLVDSNSVFILDLFDTFKSTHPGLEMPVTFMENTAVL